MSEEKPDWVLFMEDLDRPMMSLEQRANKIADVVASGDASQEFLRQLAEMIRPHGKHCDLSLVLQYKKPHEPRRLAWRVGEEMVRLVDDENETVDKAIYQIQKQFGEEGNSRSKCLAAMKQTRAERRAWQKIDNSDPE